MLLELDTLKFKGIGRFLEEQTIDLQALGKFVQLNGQNNNTKGSSGAGKSTVFMALDYLLGVSHRPGTVLKCRFSDEGIWVQAIGKYDDKPIKITRGKKLSIELDGVVTEGNSTKTEEKLDSIMGMPTRELFRKMLHKRQDEGGFFLNMGPTDTNSFLMHALGLSEEKVRIAILDKKIEEVSERKKNVGNLLAAANAGFSATTDAILAMGLAPVKDIHEPVVEALGTKASASKSALDVALHTAKLEEENLNLSRPSIATIPFDRSTILALEKQVNEASARITSVKWAEKERQDNASNSLRTWQKTLEKYEFDVAAGEKATAKALETAEQIKKTKDGKCYTCGQNWVDLKTQESLMSTVKTLRAQIEAGKKAALEIPQAKDMVAKLALDAAPRSLDIQADSELVNSANAQLVSERQKEASHQAEQNFKNKVLWDTFTGQEQALRAKHRTTLDQLRGQADLDRRAYEIAFNKLKTYEDAHTRYHASLSALKAQEKAYSTKVTDLSTQAAQIDQELAMAEELKRAHKSYLSRSFDEALETISENATDLIRHIPNMANATIQLEGTKETQAGKIKEEVNATIHMDGESNVDIRSLCGGERTALDLAIDLSVIDLLESKANKGVNLFILDEPFKGLDTICIENALEVLKNSNSKKRIIIVDHNPEVKEMVESSLTVIRDGAISRVTQS